MIKYSVFGAVAMLLVLSLNYVYAKQLSQPQLYAVLYYADWCGSCKKLDPKIEQAKKQSKLLQKDILFVRFDFTDDANSYQSELLADSLDLHSSFAEYGDKTGFMLLIDSETKQVLSRLTKNMSAGDIAKEFESAIAKTNS